MAVERKFVKERVNRMLVREYVRKETERAGFGGLEIQRTPLGTRINITAERPGMVIGRHGSSINDLTRKLADKFDLQNPQLSADSPKGNPNLNASIMAYKVAESLERGWHFRRVGHSTVQRIMESGAQGVIVEISGKVTGAKRRREQFIAGHIKYCGDTAYELMETGMAQCKKKLGVIGCTVRIMRKDAVLPDRVNIKNLTDAPVAPVKVTHVSKPMSGEEVVAAPAPVEAVAAPLPEGLETMTVSQLKALATERSIDLTGKSLKDDIIETIKAGPKPKRARRSFSVGEA